MSGFRRDLELAPGPQFRLRRRLWPRLLSAAGVLGGAGLGIFDIAVGYRLAGGAMLALAIAFVVQLVQAEIDSWRFDGEAAVRRRLVISRLAVRELRLRASEIAGVPIELAGSHARAWIETREGEQYPLVEGGEAEVRRIADRLAALVAVAGTQAPKTWVH